MDKTQYYLELSERMDNNMLQGKDFRVIELLQQDLDDIALSVADLESNNELTRVEMDHLAIMYLTHICKLEDYSAKDLISTNYRSVSQNPAIDCVKRDEMAHHIDFEIPRLRIVEDEINNAAYKIAYHNIKQKIAQKIADENKPYNQDTDFFKMYCDGKDMRRALKKAYLQDEPSDFNAIGLDLRQEYSVIALALKRYFFDRVPQDTPIPFTFDWKRLHEVRDVVLSSVQNQQLLDTSNFIKVDHQINKIMIEYYGAMLTKRDEQVTKSLLSQLPFFNTSDRHMQEFTEHQTEFKYSK